MFRFQRPYGDNNLSEKKTKLIRADEAQVLLLDRLLAEIRNVKTRLEEQIPVGAVEPIEKFRITDVRRHMLLVKPWFSVSVINDDDHNDVFCIVNTEKSFEEHRILPHETYNIAMITAVIKDLLFWCNHGETSNVRVVGVR